MITIKMCSKAKTDEPGERLRIDKKQGKRSERERENAPRSFVIHCHSISKCGSLLWFSGEKIFLLKCLLNSVISTEAVYLGEVDANVYFFFFSSSSSIYL